MRPLFLAADLTAERVSDDDVDLFQPLLERCEDFYQRCFGRPARPDEARQIPLERPPGLGPERGHLVALRDAEGALVGILEAVSDFPSPDEWYLGLMRLGPEARGRGRARPSSAGTRTGCAARVPGCCGCACPSRTPRPGASGHVWASATRPGWGR